MTLIELSNIQLPTNNIVKIFLFRRKIGTNTADSFMVQMYLFDHKASV